MNELKTSAARAVSNRFNGWAIQRVRQCPARAIGMIAKWLVIFMVSFVNAAPVQLISGRDPSVALPAGANDNSSDAVISSDGRFIVFSSAAADLVPGHDRQLNLDVYLYDRASNRLALVSANLTGIGGNSHSIFGRVSSDGHYVLFQSDASDLATNDSDFYTDIFVRDPISGTTTLVSAPTNGNFGGTGSSSSAVMTPDSRYVAFVSASWNLLAGDTNGIPDIYLRDLSNGNVFLVSTGAVRNPLVNSAFPVMATPVITPDGRYVAFFSTAAGLAGPNPPAGGEVYVRDLIAGTTTLASSNAAAIALATFGTLSNYISYHPVLSDGGRFLACKAAVSPNPFPSNYTNAIVLLNDLSSGTTTVIDTNALGTGPVDEDRFGPEMTPDGQFVAYVHQEPGPPGAYSSVHVWDSQTATDILVSDNGSGVPPGTASDSPVISPDGRFVAFLSNATNLVANIVASGFHIYLRDLQTGTTQLIDVDTNGAGSTDMTGVIPSLSADGRYVVFDAQDGSLVAQDNNGRRDVFLRDTVAGTTTMISARNPTLVPVTGNGITRLTPYSASANGRWFAFESVASDLIPNDNNNFQDVFVKDLQTGQTTLVSAGTDGNPATGGRSGNPLLSADGRFVVFLSEATNLLTGQATSNLNVFRHDLQTGTTLLVSTTNGIDAANGPCTDPVMSSDGRYVAFLSFAASLSGLAPQGSPWPYWRDIASGMTVRLNSNSVAVTLPPSMSSDGRYVTYFGSVPSVALRIRDTSTGRDVYTNTTMNASTSSAVLSPDGTKLLYLKALAPSTLYVDDVLNGTNLFSFPNAAIIQNSGQWSSDSRYFVFVSRTNTMAGDLNPTNKVYLCDLLTRSVTLVSVNCGHTASASGNSDMPVITGDGRFVIYRSTAPDLVPFDANPAPKIFLYDTSTAVNTILGPAQNDPSSFPWISPPIVSAGGQQVGFQSVGASLVPGDFNRVSDGFTTGLDSDSDGVPDAWTLQYFGHAAGQAGDLSRATDDADGDGVSNLQEYLNGTNPRSATADFTIQIFPIVTQGNTVTLTWPSTVAANFTVQYINNFNVPLWQDLPGTISIVANRAYFTVPADLPSRFYRVVGSN